MWSEEPGLWLPAIQTLVADCARKMLLSSPLAPVVTASEARTSGLASYERRRLTGHRDHFLHRYLCCALRCPVSRGCGTRVLTWVIERRGGSGETCRPHPPAPTLSGPASSVAVRSGASTHTLLLTHLENGEKSLLPSSLPLSGKTEGQSSPLAWTSLEPGPASWPALWEPPALAEDRALIPGSGGHVRACPQMEVQVRRPASLQLVPEARRYGPQGYKVRQPTSLTSP